MSSTFTLQSDNYTVYLSKPQWESEDNKLNKTLKLFDFWDTNIENVDIDIESQPLRLAGLEEYKIGYSSSMCFPLCFPICFSPSSSSSSSPTLIVDYTSIEIKFKNIWNIMENHEKVTISGLGDEYDGTYVIRDFRFSTLERGRGYFRWELVLEKA